MLAKEIKKVAYLQKSLSFLPKYYESKNFYKRSYTKAFTIADSNCVLSVNCAKGKFVQIKDYIVLDKLGSIYLDFIPKTQNRERPFDLSQKRNFTINLKTIGEIIKINPYQLSEKAVKIEFQYVARSIEEEKKLTIQKGEKEEQIKFHLWTSRAATGESNLIVNADIGDFVILQELLRYSVPYIMGWHTLASPRIAEEEFNASHSVTNFDN